MTVLSKLERIYNLKPVEIAKLIGISKSYYSMIRNGERPISKSVAIRLKQQFGIKLEDSLCPGVHEEKTVESDHANALSEHFGCWSFLFWAEKHRLLSLFWWAVFIILVTLVFLIFWIFFVGFRKSLDRYGRGFWFSTSLLSFSFSLSTALAIIRRAAKILGFKGFFMIQ